MESNDYLAKLRKQHYSVIGRHSAVKICSWLKKSLRDQGTCYKQKFYGISSHRCLQMTPNVYCNQRCVFCWRTYDDNNDPIPSNWDEPEFIIEEAIKAQRKLINGFPGAEGLNKKKFEEAFENEMKVEVKEVREIKKPENLDTPPPVVTSMVKIY